MNKTQRYDTYSFTAQRTSEGFIEDSPIVGRTGILEYMRPDGTIEREYRPPEEAFNEQSLLSLKGKPITVGHHGRVDSHNVDSIHPIGTVLSSGRKEDTNDIVADIILYTLPTQDRELSCGYTLDLDMTEGVTPEGEHYDAIQRNIRYNHLAVVARGRAGVARLNMDGDQETEISEEQIQKIVNGMIPNNPVYQSDKYKSDCKALKEEKDEEKRKMLTDCMHYHQYMAHVAEAKTVGKPQKIDKSEFSGFKNKAKAADGEYVAVMTPQEYMQHCAYDIFQNGTMKTAFDGFECKKAADYANKMKNGAKFDIPSLNFTENKQGGRHRAIAACADGIEKIPVLIIGMPHGNTHPVEPPQRDGLQKPKEDKMAKVKVDNGLSYEAAPEVECYVNKLQGQVKDLTAKLNEAKKAHEDADNANKALKDAQDAAEKSKKDIDALQAKFDSVSAENKKMKEDAEKAEKEFKEKFDSAVKSRIELINVATAHKIEKADSMTDKEIKIAVIHSVRGNDFNVDGKSDDYIEAAYDFCKESGVKTGTEEQHSQAGTPNQNQDDDDDPISKAEKALKDAESKYFMMGVNTDGNSK